MQIVSESTPKKGKGQDRQHPKHKQKTKKNGQHFPTHMPIALLSRMLPFFVQQTPNKSLTIMAISVWERWVSCPFATRGCLNAQYSCKQRRERERERKREKKKRGTSCWWQGWGTGRRPLPRWGGRHTRWKTNQYVVCLSPAPEKEKLRREDIDIGETWKRTRRKEKQDDHTEPTRALV